MSSKLNRLRLVGKMEGISFLMIFGISMPLKYMYDMHMPNKIIGMIHGVLFIWYVLLLYWVSDQKKWDGKTIFFGLLAAVLPFGTFVADKKIFAKYADEEK